MFRCQLQNKIDNQSTDLTQWSSGVDTRGPFLESPETLRAIFRCHNSPCISRTERIRVVNFHSQFAFCYLENMLKERLSRTSGWQVHKWLFWPERFPGLSRNGPKRPLILVRETGPRLGLNGIRTHVARSPPIKKRIWVGRYNKSHWPLLIGAFQSQWNNQWNDRTEQ